MNEENMSFAELLNDSLKKNNKLEKIVTGKIISITNDNDIYVDINYKADGIITKKEYSFDETKDPHDEFKIGDKITCEVIKLNDGLGNVLLSYKRVKQRQAREEFDSKVSNNEIFQEKVIEANKNGVIAEYKGIRVFIPSSLSQNAKLQDDVRFKVIENNPKEHRIIGSIKAVVEEEKQQKEEQFFNTAEVGMSYEGKVSSVCSYGAFVDLDGVQGLLHISEISWERNDNANNYLKPDQTIKVYIKNIDKENKRVQLSCDMKGEDPWNLINIKVGDIVKVTIKKLVPFGAFAEIEKGVEGLIHISQIADEKITKPEEKLQIGEEVNAKVIDVDLENKKIELSIKELIGTSNEYSSVER